jgi:hypothetical protein
MGTVEKSIPWMADRTVTEVMARAYKAARDGGGTVKIEKEPFSTLTSIYLVGKDGSSTLYRRFNTRLTGAEIIACVESARKFLGA